MSADRHRDSIAFCYDVATQGTSFEGARLEIVGGHELRIRSMEVEDGA